MNSITIEYAPFDCWTDEVVGDWNLLKTGENETVLFRRPAPVFGIDELTGMKMPMSAEEFLHRYYCWKRRGMKIQEAFENLPDDARNFIQFGMSPDVWDLMWGEED